MRFTDVEIPPWFHDQLLQRYGQGFNFNHIIAFLLEDYLARNNPDSPMYRESTRIDRIIDKRRTHEIETVEVKMEKKAYVTLKCIRDDGNLILKDRLTIGKKYIVLEVSKCGLYLRVKDDRGNLSFFNANRFSL